MKQNILAGQVFRYRQSADVFNRRLLAGQILERSGDVVFVRIYDPGDDSKPIIAFLPIAIAAFEQSPIEYVKQAELPDHWEIFRDEWRALWLAREAGVFSLPLAEITEAVSQTVDDWSEGTVIELAFPKRSKSGDFDTIAAYVQQ